MNEVTKYKGKETHRNTLPPEHAKTVYPGRCMLDKQEPLDFVDTPSTLGNQDIDADSALDNLEMIGSKAP